MINFNESTYVMITTDVITKSSSFDFDLFLPSTKINLASDLSYPSSALRSQSQRWQPGSNSIVP